MAVEIPLRRKYRYHTVKKQTSRHEGNPSNKRNKAKGDALAKARAATEAHQRVKVMDGMKVKWMSAQEWASQPLR